MISIKQILATFVKVQDFDEFNKCYILFALRDVPPTKNKVVVLLVSL